ALGHCGECHTPRGWLGGTDEAYALSGTPDGPEGDKVPNVTPHPETGLGGWEKDAIIRVLRTGMLPDGDYVGSGMGEVVDTSTSKLTDADRDAIATYLMSLPPIDNPDAKATRPGSAWE
ncbi:MAG TPA: cytochrome c, partial [Dongiaceae bacterium]